MENRRPCKNNMASVMSKNETVVLRMIFLKKHIKMFQRLQPRIGTGSYVERSENLSHPIPSFICRRQTTTTEEPSSLHNSKHTKHTHAIRVQNTLNNTIPNGSLCANNHCSTQYEQSFCTINIHILIRKLLQTSISDSMDYARHSERSWLFASDIFTVCSLMC